MFSGKEITKLILMRDFSLIFNRISSIKYLYLPNNKPSRKVKKRRMRKLYLGVSLTVGKQMIRLTHRKRNMKVEAEASAQIQVFRFWKSLTSLTSVRLTTTRSTTSSWAREAR